MNRVVEVKLDDRTIEVKKLPIGRYVELLKAFDGILPRIGALDGISNDEVLSRLPVIISESLPDMINILVLTTELKKEEVEQLGLDECINILESVVEVNNLKSVFEKVKKVMARPGITKPKI